MSELKYDSYDAVSRLALTFVLAVIVLLLASIAGELDVVDDGVRQFTLLSVYAMFVYAALPAVEMLISYGIDFGKWARERVGV